MEISDDPPVAGLLARHRRARERRRAWESHWRFSFWNPGNPNRRVILAVEAGDPVFAGCLRIARRAVAGVLRDPTGGATHYHHRAVLPAWAVAKAPCAEIGAHLFYRDID